MTYEGDWFNTSLCLKNHIKYLYFTIAYKSLWFGSVFLLKVHLWKLYAAIFSAFITLSGKAFVVPGRAHMYINYCLKNKSFSKHTLET